MSGTIRDYLKKRTRIFFGVALLGWLMCAGGMLTLRPISHCKPNCGGGPPLVAFTGFPLFFGAIIGFTIFVKCPRCSGRLGALAATTVTRGFLSRPINFCPYCGVNLDEPYRNPQSNHQGLSSP